jgi:hypothetical protein
MALIDDESVAKRASYRVKTAGTKLSRNELAALEEHCRKLLTAEAFDGIMAEVKKRKKAVAAEARQEAEGV